MSPRIKTYTLGCKVNQYETEYVRQGLIGIGFQDAGEHEPADLCIVNTCTVTQEGDSKSRQVIRRLARDNPHARIVVMGCYATRAPGELAALPGVSEVVTDKRELPDLLGRFGVVDIPSGISQFGQRHRAYLKVQDGCLLRCSYCMIPHVRPHVISRGVPEILDEVRRLLDNGYREFVLTGVHLGHYGVEQNRGQPKASWLRLSHLVRQLAAVEGDFRLRLSSIEATEVTRELVETVAEFPDKVCPHFHICLQSGSDRILRRMRRRWAARMFVDRCRFVQDRLPCPALTTDVIVGFPAKRKTTFRPPANWCARSDSRRSTSSRSARGAARPPPTCRTRFPRARRRNAANAWPTSNVSCGGTTSSDLSGGHYACWSRRPPMALRTAAPAPPAAMRLWNCRRVSPRAANWSPACLMRPTISDCWHSPYAAWRARFAPGARSLGIGLTVRAATVPRLFSVNPPAGPFSSVEGG